MERVLVAGISGSGKTTFARRLSERSGLPHHELDALHHGPGWVKRPEFEADVEAFSAEPRWITEDQHHGALGDTLWERADTVIWLDMPKRVVMWRVVRRSFVRSATRRELWNGNRERWRDWLNADHPIRWAWSRYDRKRVALIARSARHPEVNVVHVRDPRQAEQILSRLPRSRARQP